MSVNAVVDRPATPGQDRLRVFADGSYRRLWGIGAVNSVMRWMEMVAVSVYVLDLTGSVWSLTLVSFFRALPMLTFGVFFGAIADRLDRRKILMSVMLLLACVYAALGTLVVIGRIEVWHIYAGTFLVGVGWATDFPVRRNMVSDIVGLPRIATAIGVDQATMNVSRIIGPTVSGAAVQFIGVQAAYFTGAAMYALALVLAAGVTWRRQAPTGPAPNPFSNIAEGFRYVRSNEVIMATLAITVIVNLFVFPYTFVVPAIARDVLGVGPILLGVLTSVEGLGATLGSVLIATRTATRHYTRVYVFGSLLFATTVLVFAAVPWYGLSLPLVFVGGLGMAGFGAMQSIIILSATPTEMRGRVLGVLTVAIGSGPLGALLIGRLSQDLGPRVGVAIIGAAGLAGILISAVAWPRFLRTREMGPGALGRTEERNLGTRD